MHKATQLFFGEGKDRPILTPADLIQYLPEHKRRHYRCGYSMAETAKSWVNASGGLPASIAAIVRSDGLTRAHFEYPVAVWGGGISMTDVRAFVPSGVIAVEGKAREPFDETVHEWIVREKGINERSPDHRRNVADQYATAFCLADGKLLLDIRYQLLHRTLSAAKTARKIGAKQAWMVIQSFAPMSCPEHVRNRGDFDRYIALVGSAPVLEGVPVRLAWAQEAVAI
jgi:hypothetical protein